MTYLITEKIKRLAQLKYGGDVNKAAAEHFSGHPEDWQRHTEETTVVKKRDGEDPDWVYGQIQYEIQKVARRDGLDLTKPTDEATAQARAMSENPDLYKRHRAACAVRVGKVSLTD